MTSIDEDSPLLSRARERAAELLGLGAAPRSWTLGEPVHRRKSLLVPLELGSLHAFYKQRLEPGPEGADGTRAALRRAFDASPALAATAGAEQIDFPVTLAIDLDHLASIDTTVPGDHPGRAAWGSRSRRAALYRSVGRAVQLLEDSCPLPASTPVSTWPLDFDPHSAESLLSAADAEAVRSRLAELHDAAGAAGHPVTVWNGDLGSANILTSGARVGIIDISWEPAFRGSDVCVLAWRLELERLQTAARTAHLVHALLAGYGDTALATTPAWRFERLRRLAHALSQPAWLGRFRRGALTRALGEVREELGR